VAPPGPLGASLDCGSWFPTNTPMGPPPGLHSRPVVLPARPAENRPPAPQEISVSRPGAFECPARQCGKSGVAQGGWVPSAGPIGARCCFSPGRTSKTRPEQFPPPPRGPRFTPAGRPTPAVPPPVPGGGGLPPVPRPPTPVILRKLRAKIWGVAPPGTPAGGPLLFSRGPPGPRKKGRTNPPCVSGTRWGGPPPPCLGRPGR